MSTACRYVQRQVAIPDTSTKVIYMYIGIHTGVELFKILEAIQNIG